MIADSSGHVERRCGFDSFHSSHSRRPETGRLGECRPTPATGRVQTQRSAAKIEQPGLIILDRPVLDLAGLEIRFDIRAAETVTSWHHKRFKRYWWKLSQPKPGRPGTRSEVRTLIHSMARANPTWGAP